MWAITSINTDVDADTWCGQALIQFQRGKTIGQFETTFFESILGLL